MKNKILLLSILSALTATSYAQTQAPTMNQVNAVPTSVIQVVSPADSNNRVNLNAVGRQEVDQDNLIIRLTYTNQGNDAKSVQDALTKEISSSLQQAKKYENQKNLIVRSGQFSVYPKYEKQQLVSWVGQGEIILEGQDLALVSRVASELNTTNNMVISSINLGLSNEKSESLKEQTVQQAISNFKLEAQKITQMFGFRNYRIKEVSVNYNQPVMGYRAAPMMAKSGMAADMAVESVRIEPGKTVIEANVNGSIEMFN